MDPLEAIRSIPGPAFLLIFLAICLLAGIVLRLWLRADGSTRYQMTSLLSPDPVAVAFLNGGKQAAKRAILLRLLERGILTMDSVDEKKPKKTTIKCVREKRQETRDGMEVAICNYFAVPNSLDSYFIDYELDKKFEGHLAPMVSKLETEHLLRNSSERRRAWLKVLIVVTALLVFGGTKLSMGLTYNMPSGYLMLLLIVVVVVFPFFNTKRKITTLGRRYLKQLATSMVWAKEKLKEGARGPDVDPVLLASVFGAGTLMMLPEYKELGKGMSPGASGGCGGGCAGGSGGGCGGGCGGCGGGCGGG